jgi:hypothetical protein
MGYVTFSLLSVLFVKSVVFFAYDLFRSRILAARDDNVRRNAPLAVSGQG